ncbi:MAG: HAD hydrolase family protein [Ruminococcus callidus]
MQNFIFFDIDGTIISEDGYLPESAVRAIQAARKKGNATFINTGRTAMNVDSFLREIGFNGYVYGCGTELEYDGKVLFHKKRDTGMQPRNGGTGSPHQCCRSVRTQRCHVHRPQHTNFCHICKIC